MDGLARLFIWILFITVINGGFYDVFAPCCHEGVQWSSASYRCDNYPAPVVNISDNDQTSCLSIIEVCCIKQTQLLACEEGKMAAMDDQLCAVRDTEPGAEQFRECCHCCHLGMESRVTTPACQSPGLGEPCDSKYRECCTGEKSGNLSFAVPSTSIYTSTPIPPPTTNPTTESTTPKADDSITPDNETDDGDDDDDDDDDDEDEVTDYYPDLDECQLFLGELCSHICVNTLNGYHCECPPGFILDPTDNATCMAVGGPGIGALSTLVTVTDAPDQGSSQGGNGGEADEQYNCVDNNPCEQRCAEIPRGGVRCRCYEGYALQPDQTSCEDIDECSEGVPRCAQGQTCVNTKGSYTCTAQSCPPGFIMNRDSGRCEADVDQCARGFKFESRTGRCEDINECGLGIDTCGTGERCENTRGSYACRRLRHCGTGYTLDEESQRCTDNNECELGTHNCLSGYQCQNTRGSFRCVPVSCPQGSRFNRTTGGCVAIECPTGLRPNPAGNCMDIDECEERGPNICRRHQRCINTRGSYYCRNFINCPPGYEPRENNGCQDVDECATGTHRCGVEQECVNRQGSYFCQCPRGMRHDNTGRCVDVDECSYGAAICPSNSQCVNTIGSFKCDCVDGLVADGDDSCKDVDECAQQAGICQQNCVNVVGTFFCSCNRGYQLKDDKRSCEDIDECTQFKGRQGRSGVCGGECINLPGSYKCTCPNGWRLKPDERSCEDINECREGTAFCPHSESLCINTRGGYKCPVIRCPEGYIKTNSSTQQNSIKCRRVTTNCPECKRGLLSRTFNFISFASNVQVPAPLFSMTGSRLVDKFYSWELDLITARPLRAGVPEADATFFSLEKSRDFARVSLLRQIPGPQDLVLKMTMNVTSYYKGFEGMAESRIYLYVTDADKRV